MTSDNRRQIVESLADKEYRDAFVEAEIDTGLAYQIRGMREARGWSQRDLGERVPGGMAQAVVSKLEDPEYGRHTLSTLKRLASAFDVALVVRFVPFSELVDWMVNLPEERLSVPSFQDDAGLRVPAAAAGTASARPLNVAGTDNTGGYVFRSWVAGLSLDVIPHAAPPASTTAMSPLSTSTRALVPALRDGTNG